MTLPLAEAAPVLERLRPRVLFSDVDGTLVGRRASLLADLDGRPTLVAASALVAAHTAGLEIVLVSGRTRAQLQESGRLLGVRDAVAELGTVLVVDGGAELEWGRVPRALGPTPAEVLRRSGALDLVLAAFEGRLEFHTPWHEGRQGTALLRGLVDLEQARALLRGEGFDWADLVDNGRLRGAYPRLGLAAGEAHTYHLAPAGVTKGSAAARYLRLRGIGREEAAAVGDSAADLELDAAVGAMFLVGNAGPEARAAAGPDTVVAAGRAGEGWAEVVAALLARMEAGGAA
ncbi:MAG TPA: HAD hydrolase family protein [Actinomycetes bacterium]|nr:HAD hydrolase family protein [Actinomycetes bacterium]